MKQSLALGLYMGWLWSLYLNGPLLHAFDTDGPLAAGQIFLVYFASHSLTLLISRHNATGGIFARKNLLYCAAGAIAAGSLFPLYTSLLPGSGWLLATAGVLAAGVGSALLLVACGLYFRLLPVRRAAAAFAGAVLIGSILFCLLQAIPPQPALAVVACLPLVAARLAVPQITLPETAPIEEGIASGALPAKLRILIIIIYTSAGLMHKSIGVYLPPSLVETYWVTIGIYCLFCFAGAAAIYKLPDLDLRLLWRPVVPLLAAGFILFPLFAAKSDVVLPFALLKAGFALFDLYTWLLFVYLAGFYRAPHKIIAEGMFLITFFIFAGDFLFTHFSPFADISPQKLPALLYSAAIVLLLATLIFREERETFSGWTPSAVPPAVTAPSAATVGEAAPSPSLPPAATPSPPAEPLTSLVAIHRLSAREQEVMLLLAKGRNNPFIVEQLNISSNTLKTHLRNLYQKCGVANRQELLSLIENWPSK